MNMHQEDLTSKKNSVYLYTNTVNNKVYVGRTMQSLKARANKHGSGYKSCTKFWNAICKYGWDKFRLEILAENISYEESVRLEKYYIQLYKSNQQEFGYNILSEEPNRGFLPEEVKNKIRAKKFELTPEQRKNISNAHLGQKAWNKGLKTGPLSEKQKAKFSEARKGNKNSIHVQVQDITTGEVFRSGAEAGRSINRTSEAIFWSIKNNKPCNGHYFKRM